MPATYKLLPEHGLCYVRFWGDLRMQEVEACMADFAKDPDGLRLNKHLVDFSGITEYDHNIVRILEFQATSVDVFSKATTQWIFAYYAPTLIGRELALFGVRAWSEHQQAVIRICDTESAALDILGLQERRLSDLLNSTHPR